MAIAKHYTKIASAELLAPFLKSQRKASHYSVGTAGNPKCANGISSSYEMKVSKVHG